MEEKQFQSHSYEINKYNNTKVQTTALKFQKFTYILPLFLFIVYHEFLLKLIFENSFDFYLRSLIYIFFLQNYLNKFSLSKRRWSFGV